MVIRRLGFKKLSPRVLSWHGSKDRWSTGTMGAVVPLNAQEGAVAPVCVYVAINHVDNISQRKNSLKLAERMD